MKKIYNSFLFLALILSGNAQDAKFSELSEDLKASLSMPVKQIDLSQVQHQKQGGSQLFKTNACDTMGTTWAAGNSHNGNMFDLVNTNSVSVQIISFDQCFATLQADSFSIFYKSGTFVGSETTPSAWTFAGRCYMSPAVTNSPLPIPITLTVSIPPSATYGFYLTNEASGSSNAYTNGTSLGNVLRTKDGIQFLEGKGGGYPFAVSFSPRVWNGVIHYCSPLVLGVSSLSLNESASDIYPNPMADEATVSINSSIKMNNAKLTVTDLAGRIVHVKNNLNENTFALTHNLKSGLYIVKVENDNTIVLNKKIAVQ